MQNKKNAVVNKVRHSRGMLSGIYNACRCQIKGNTLLDRYVEDPRTLRAAKSSGMTPHWITTRAFTLIELLVVVLIIGILAAVAVPQYQRAVEKARMVEAVTNVRAIANAHQLYYLENGKYLGTNDMDKLAITIPGTVDHTFGVDNRIKTKDFIYSPNGASNSYLAIAQRVVPEGAEKYYAYYIYIGSNTPQQIHCSAIADSSATTLQRALCKQLDETGTL